MSARYAFDMDSARYAFEPDSARYVFELDLVHHAHNTFQLRADESDLDEHCILQVCVILDHLMQCTLAGQMCGIVLTLFILPSNKVNQIILQQLKAKVSQCKNDNSKTKKARLNNKRNATCHKAHKAVSTCIKLY